MGHYVLSVVAIGDGRSGKKEGPSLSASYFEWFSTSKHPDLSHLGPRFPYSKGGLFRFWPPHSFTACNTGTLGGAMGGRLSGPGEIIMKLRVSWGNASAPRLRRVFVDSDGGNMHLANSAGEVSGTVTFVDLLMLRRMCLFRGRPVFPCSIVFGSIVFGIHSFWAILSHYTARAFFPSIPFFVSFFVRRTPKKFGLSFVVRG